MYVYNNNCYCVFSFYVNIHKWMHISVVAYIDFFFTWIHLCTLQQYTVTFHSSSYLASWHEDLTVDLSALLELLCLCQKDYHFREREWLLTSWGAPPACLSISEECIGVHIPAEDQQHSHQDQWHPLHPSGSSQVQWREHNHHWGRMVNNTHQLWKQTSLEQE